MHKSFIAQVSVVLEMSDDEFNFLFACAENHYDGTIAAETRQGGHLYDQRNARLHFDAGMSTTFTSCQLQIAMKALEFATEGQQAQARQLQRDIRAGWESLQAASKFANNQLLLNAKTF